MTNAPDVIVTKRLLLRPWRPTDLDAFALMHADPLVMDDLGGPISRERSEQKLQRYISAYQKYGYSRFCVENSDRQFIGYVGVCPRKDDQQIGSHDEIGWRLVADAWGQGLATEAAHACLSDFFQRNSSAEILSYTSPENIRSRAVMERLALDREPQRDFVWENGDGSSVSMMVWVARSIARQ